MSGKVKKKGATVKHQLVADFMGGHPPAAIQRSIAREYGVDLDARLQAVAQDLLDHFSEYFV